MNLGEDYSSMKFFKGKGCKRCRDTGYAGRVSIMEVLPVTGRIRELLLKGDSVEQIHNTAVEEGMTPLVEDGWIKVFKGITTIDEVVRVTNIR